MQAICNPVSKETRGNAFKIPEECGRHGGEKSFECHVPLNTKQTREGSIPFIS